MEIIYMKTTQVYENTTNLKDHSRNQ